jgi:aspartate kinase
MKVFKFGGASLKDSDGVKNVASIIVAQLPHPVLVVVSAMGKTTDMLERTLTLAASKKNYQDALTELKKYHYKTLDALFPESAVVRDEVEVHFDTLEKDLSTEAPFDQRYDQVVSKGELISSLILYHYLLQSNSACHWHDARTSICTDNNFREGRVDWLKTSEAVAGLAPILKKKNCHYPGFYRWN